MKEVKPVYYDKFRCKADKCKHSCCIGWEIDIDEETLDRYKSVQGEFGCRLKSGIDFNESCFVLDENERCQFLNKQGLCDVILNLGESSLCDICSDHPRFRNFFSEITEIGLGLCCEEAARIIITAEEPFGLSEEEIGSDESESAFFDIRNSLFDMAQDRSLPLKKRMDNILLFVQVDIPDLTDDNIYNMLSNLEILDESWKKVLDSLKTDGESVEADENVFERLLVYFIFRHTADSVYDGLLCERTGFCVMCVKMLQRLCLSCNSTAEIIETARMFSSEIEYSFENTTALISRCKCKKQPLH